MGNVVGQPVNMVQEVDATLHQLNAQLGCLISQNDNHAAIDYLHTFLVERALRTQFDHDQVQRAAQLLQAQRGTVTIEDVATHCHLSRRQLERKFNEAVGVSPKMLAKKIRFEYVRDRL